MNNNHPDETLLEAIHQLLEHGKPSNDDLLNDLAQCHPPIRAEFKQNLEDRLIAQHRQQNKVNSLTDHSNNLTISTSSATNPIPITLAAAVLMMLLAGLLIININPLAQPAASSAQNQMNLSPEPTFIPLTGFGNVYPVVIALQDIPHGTKLTEELLMITYWPETIAGIEYESTYRESQMLEGLYTQQDIPVWQPILSNMVGTESQVEPTSRIIVPPDYLAISIPLERFESAIDTIVVGDHVDIVGTMLYVDANDIGQNFQQNIWTTPANGEPTFQVTQRLIENAVVVAFHKVNGISTIMLAVLPQDAQVLNWMLEANLPIRLNVAKEELATLRYTDVTLSFDSVQQRADDTLSVGDLVDVIGLTLNQDNPSLAEPQNTVTLTPEALITTQNALVVERIIQGVEVTRIHRIPDETGSYEINTISLRVIQSEAAKLNTYIEEGSPYLVIRQNS